MPLEELVGILTIYEQIIQNDAGSTKGKILALKSSQKNVKKKVPLKASEDIDKMIQSLMRRSPSSPTRSKGC